jgi:hypothetical protein
MLVISAAIDLVAYVKVRVQGMRTPVIPLPPLFFTGTTLHLLRTRVAEDTAIVCPSQAMW